MQRMLGSIAITITGLCVAGWAQAAPMSWTQYRGTRSEIEKQYRVDAEQCRRHKGDERDVCLKEAVGARDTALAEARAEYKRTPQAHKQAREERTEARYKVAKERCDSFSGNARDACQERAKTELEQAKRLVDTTSSPAQGDRGHRGSSAAGPAGPTAGGTGNSTSR